MRRLIMSSIVALWVTFSINDLPAASTANHLSKDQITTDEIDSLVDSLNSLYHEGHTETALILGDSILGWLKSKPSVKQKTVAQIYNRMSTLYANIGGHEREAFLYLDLALKIYKKESDDLGLSVVYNNMGNIFRDLSNDSKAMEYYLKSLEICKKIGSKEGEAYALKNIGILYEYQGWYEKSLEFHQEALDIRQKIGSQNQIISSLLNIAIVYSSTERYAEAKETLSNALELCRTQESELKNEIYRELASINQAMQEYQLAESNYQKAIDLSIRTKKYKVLATSLASFVQMELSIGNFQKAELSLTKYKHLIDSITYQRGNVLYYNLKFKLDSIKGNHLQALEYHKKYSLLKDSLYQIANHEKLIQLGNSLELIQTENELILETELRKQQSKIYNYMVGFLIILMLGLAYIIYLKVKSNNRLNAKQVKIENQNEQLKELNNKLNHTIEELETANETIVQQNEHISKYNNELEKIVEQRTQKLMSYADKIERFAFVAAHNLRGPISRLLGLGSIFDSAKDRREKDQIEKNIIKSCEEIDMVVRQITRDLEKHTSSKEDRLKQTSIK